jgi:hypothetical protein
MKFLSILSLLEMNQAPLKVKLNKKIVKKVNHPKTEPLEKSSQLLNLLNYSLLIKNELDCIIINKLPTTILLNDVKDSYVINENINTGYETQIFIMFMYKHINNHLLHDFNRVIYPINDYSNIFENMLKDLDEMNFLMTFSQIKQIM